MKKELFLCGALFALMAFVGCSSDDDPKTEAPTLKLSTNSVVIPADGTASTIEVTTNQTSWTASRPDDAQWCILKQENNKLIISATVNSGLTTNTTEVTVLAGTGADAKTEKVTVTQSAANAYLTIEGLEANTPVKIDAAGTSAELTINTNAANWSATRPDADTWCTLTKDGNKLKISATAYEEDAERKTTVTLSGGATPVSFEVVQKGEAPAALVYKIIIPTDFSKSYVQKVMVNGVKVAEVCKEYLRCTVADESGNAQKIDAQMVVVYPVVDGKTDLTKGLVIDNGGTVAWDVANNTCAYKAGTAIEALTMVYLSEGSLATETESTNLNATTIEADIIQDNRFIYKDTYAIVKIGIQYWMAENLRARCYADGSSILNYQKDAEWKVANDGAWRTGTTEALVEFGACYNGYAMYNEKGLAPNGWIVPSDQEWQMLLTYLGKFGANLRLSDSWKSGTNCTNITGFSLKATGYFTTASGEMGGETATKLWSTTKKEGYDDNFKKVLLPKAILLGTADKTSLPSNTQVYVSGNYIRCVKKVNSTNE